MTSVLDEWAAQQLRDIDRAGRLRRVRSFDARGPRGALDGREVISFASNDYLGLSSHPSVIGAAHDALDRWGTGATASRLVVGSRPVHAALEHEIAAWKHTEDALVFSSGYLANLAVLTTLGGPDCLIVSDALNHASIIDACRLGKSRSVVAEHNDVDHVDALLAARHEPRAIVVTDSVFSMDGDEAPVVDLAACCKRHGATLVLDDAHGVLGPDDSAIVDDADLDLVRVVTMSKALGALGGAVCASADVIDLLVNRARSFIFTTGLSPADAAASLAGLRIVRGPEGDALRATLAAHIERVRPGHPSPIVPIVVGDEGDTVRLSERLLADGMHIPAIRPPTVPPGTSRLRVALSAAHSAEEVALLASRLGVLEEVG